MSELQIELAKQVSAQCPEYEEIEMFMLAELFIEAYHKFRDKKLEME